MRTMMCLLVATAVAVGRVNGETVYAFEINGEPAEPSVRSLNSTPNEPAAGDLIFVRNVPIVLGEPGSYQFQSVSKEKAKETLVYRVGDKGKELVGVHLDRIYSDDPKPAPSELTKLKPAELKAIRGLHLERWDADVKAALGGLDAGKVAIFLRDEVLENGGLRDLPNGLSHLMLSTSSSDSKWDYASLAKQESLRKLKLDGFGSGPIDLGHIVQNKGLRYFDAGGAPLKKVGRLGALAELRVLRLAWDEDFNDLRPVAKLGELRLLDIRSTGVTDLSPIAKLPQLREVNANKVAVSKLPEAEMPSLRELRIMSAKLTSAAVEAFEKRNPKAEVWHDWGSALNRALAGIDKLRVRSGGTCHRDVTAERTLFETEDGEVIGKLIASIRLREDPDGGHCMCCGDPSFEFYKDGELHLTLGFHHGHGLRWSAGWPSDGAITDDSAEFLCRFLDARGVKKPLRDYMEGRGRKQASARRFARYRALLPAPLLDALRDGGGARGFAEKVPDATQRALLCFRLFGCHEDSWNLSAGIDEMLAEELLPEIEEKTIIESLLPKCAEDPELCSGVGRWVFDQHRRETYSEEVLGKHFAVLARHGLAHPREASRLRCFSALAEMGGEASLTLLRQCLGGQIPLRDLDEEHQAEPGGMVSFSGGALDIPDGAGNRVGAALALAKRGDKDSLKEIEALAAAAKSEAVKAALEKAAAQLR